MCPTHGTSRTYAVSTHNKAMYHFLFKVFCTLSMLAVYGNEFSFMSHEVFLLRSYICSHAFFTQVSILKPGDYFTYSEVFHVKTK